jgi:hypothetical protein
VLVQVAKPRALPAAEGMMGQRYGDRHIDIHNANLDAGSRPAQRTYFFLMQ